MAKRDIDIEALLVWAYRDQCVDEAPRNIAGPRTSRMRFDIGVDCDDRVDEVHSDAHAIHSAVRGLSRFQSALVMACAKVSTVPEWYPGAKPVMAAVLNGRGNPAGIYDRNGNVIGHRVRMALELASGTIIYGGGEADLATVRAQYMVWHEALSALAVALADTLEDYKVTGPSAAREPWSAPITIGEKAA